MDGKNKIIQQIIADGESRCKAIIAKAEKDAMDIISDTNARIQQDSVALSAKIDANSTSIVDNAMSNAKLDIRKYNLWQKQALIDSVYDKALQHLLALSDKKYVELIIKLLTKYAENGEVVSISSKDSTLITQAVLDKSGKKLTLCKQYIDIDGGVVLSSKSYDKVLTLSMLVHEARATTESQVANTLFEVQ